MSVIKPRSRLVYFRVTEEEFAQFQTLCRNAGARSISDMLRVAMQRKLLEDQASADTFMSSRLDGLCEAIARLSERVERLWTLVECQNPRKYQPEENRDL